MDSKYEIPEEVNRKCIRTLGYEVQMKTFKAINLEPEEGAGNQDENDKTLIKIVCLGGYTGGCRTKATFITDYLMVRPVSKSFKPTIGVNFYLNILQRKAGDDRNIHLQLWDIAEQERFSSMCRVYFKDSRGAIVFWGPQIPSSLNDALRWKELFTQFCPSAPCVLITDNIQGANQSPLQYKGHGMVFDSDAAFDRFRKEHGFIDSFEITSRDWEAGEQSVFGQAVHRLLDRILPADEQETTI